MDTARPHLPFRPLESKVRPPVSTLSLVRRRSLLNELRSSDAPVVLVCAEAGAGKTVLLMQWAEAADLPTAWLQLDTADADPVRFVSYLLMALGRAIRLDPSLPDLLASPVPLIDQVVAPVLAASVSASPPFLLVIDDAHRVRDETCWRVLHAVGVSLPKGAHMAIATRADPPLPAARLHSRGRLVRLTSEDLALDLEEIREMLRLQGRVADEGHVQALVEGTEGWATGVYLASMSNGPRKDMKAPAALRTGGSELDRYFASEIFDGQPADRQEFLLRTSLLRRLTPPLCRVVTGHDHAGAMLRRLAADNIFVSELGNDGQWFRYQHLFAAFLQTELRRRAPEELPDLHRRAASWYREEGFIERALHHSLAAGDVAEAAECVAANWAPYALSGHLATATSWLDSFSEQQILSHPALTLAAGWCYAMSGNQRMGALWRRAESLEEVDGPSPDGAASLRSSRAMLRATLAQGGVGQMLRDAELAASLETDPGSSWYITANLVLGSALAAVGRTPEAIAPLLAAARHSAGKLVLPEMAALGVLALMAADEGDWDSAHRYVDRASACLTDSRIGPFCPSALVHVARALVLAHDDEPGVWEELDRARVALGQVASWPSATLPVSVFAGELNLDGGRVDEAEYWLARAQATLKVWPDAAVLLQRTDDLRQAIERRRGMEPLTLAERRVLELLPSQLSIHEIAERIGLSTNTVKTHVQHIHHKLGVSSRTPAVERARQLGLLDP
jgi:LuxR family maltose regulon positive regulatory protein